ncbi:hypothetical protein PoB_000107400 [Plakobranchus ocellatus]|uniref:Reverse transcriptase domain-containing protein n=1 Tax=Plakobranchus ocellatus TaxID=259542 RepID=A0AAV3XXB6_9GAST|nr:hypothetical protein PoB_000107400 [Plakobranchus ocellatus]
MYQSASVRIEGEHSDFKSIKRGVRQGFVMSPGLFNLNSETILRNLDISSLKPIGQRRSALSPRLGRKEWPKKFIDKRQPSCHHLNFQNPPHPPYGSLFTANKGTNSVRVGLSIVSIRQAALKTSKGSRRRGRQDYRVQKEFKKRQSKLEK